MKMSQKAKNAIMLGTLCSISYLAVYIARNVLGAVTPKMTADGFDLELIGSITASYLLSYAIGQLVNGLIGDRIKAKYMMTIGLLFAGISGIVFVNCISSTGVATIAYACMGFALSMIYAPMTKVVAENVDLVYATRCSLGYNFASLLGSPMAGLLGTFFAWQTTFNISNFTLIVISIVCFIVFTVFERKGIIKYPSKNQNGEIAKKNYKGLFKRSIVSISIVSMLTGIIRTSLVGFLSTYFYEYLGYSEQNSSSIFSIATLLIALSAFIGVFIYERLGKSINLCLFIFFAVSAASFGILYFISNPIINIIVIIIAVIASDCASTMIWSVYCPSMADTGLVSGITGFLDFVSYIAAAVGSLFIPKIVTALGWSGVIMAMLILMAIGVGVSIPNLLAQKPHSQDKE